MNKLTKLSENKYELLYDMYEIKIIDDNFRLSCNQISEVLKDVSIYYAESELKQYVERYSKENVVKLHIEDKERSIKYNINEIKRLKERIKNYINDIKEHRHSIKQLKNLLKRG